LQSSSEAAARREGRDSSPRASRRACPTSAGTRCDGRRRLPLCLSNRFCSVLLCPRCMGSIRFRSVSVPSGGAAREAAASTLGSISGFPSVAPKARIWRTFLVSILRMSVHQLKREGLHPSTADIVGFAHGIRIFDFARVGVYPRFVNGTCTCTCTCPCMLYMYRVCVQRGRLAGRAHPFAFISCAVKIGNPTTR